VSSQTLFVSQRQAAELTVVSSCASLRDKKGFQSQVAGSFSPGSLGLGLMCVTALFVELHPFDYMLYGGTQTAEPLLRRRVCYGII